MPMDKIVLLILFSIIGSVTKGNAQLQCFVCNNCPNPNELDASLIQTCGTPTTPTTTDSEDTTLTTEPTDPIITQTSPEEPPTTTPQVPVEPPTTTLQTPSEQPPTTPTSDDGSITTLTLPISPPSTTTQVPVSPPGLFGHNYRQIMRELVGEYQCFVLHQQVGEMVQVNRGCVVTQETKEQTCFDANAGVNPGFCRLCPYNECNIASKDVVSLVFVLSSVFVVLAIR